MITTNDYFYYKPIIFAIDIHIYINELRDSERYLFLKAVHFLNFPNGISSLIFLQDNKKFLKNEVKEQGW